MIYEQAKTFRDALEAVHAGAVDYLKHVSGDEKNAMNLTPDHIKQSTEYVEARVLERAAFNRVRDFNEFMIQHFQSDMRRERAEKRAQK